MITQHSLIPVRITIITSFFNTDVTPRRARGEIRSERRDSTTDGARTLFSSRSSCTNCWL